MNRSELVARLRKLEGGADVVPYPHDDRPHAEKLAALRERQPGASFALPRGRAFDAEGFADLFC